MIVLPSYGVLVALGIVLTLFCSVRVARHIGINSDQVWNLGIIALMCSLVGSRLLLITANFGDFLAHPLWMIGLAAVRNDGFLAGGVLLGGATAVIYARAVQLPLLSTMDAIAPALALGHAIGRVGCFAAGCCYGRETSLPWAVIFTSPLAARWNNTPLDVPLHPTQIYESGVELAIFIFLMWLLSRRRQPGEIAGAWLFLYGLARFLMEFLRGDGGRGHVFGGALSFPQAVAVLMVLAGGMLWLKHDTVNASVKISRVA